MPLIYYKKYNVTLKKQKTQATDVNEEEAWKYNIIIFIRMNFKRMTYYTVENRLMLGITV